MSIAAVIRRVTAVARAAVGRTALAPAGQVAEEPFTTILVKCAALWFHRNTHALAHRRGGIPAALGRIGVTRGATTRGSTVKDADKAVAAVFVVDATSARADPPTFLLEEDWEGALRRLTRVAGLLALADFTAVDDDVAELTSQRRTEFGEVDAAVVVVAAAAPIIAAGDDHAGAGRGH